MKFASKTVFTLLTLLALFVAPVAAQEVPTALNFKMKSIDGEAVSLSKYAGKVVVFVNVASKCGYTPQYKQLQELHSNYADKGVAVIGVPCNQFLGQEPGSDKEILAFCKKNYGVEFDLMSKVDVKGAKQAKLYKHLTSLELSPRGKGPIKWNFEKIVLDKTGKPIARFGSSVSPDSDEFMTVIKKAIGEQTDKSTANGAQAYSHKSKKLGKSYYLFSKTVELKNSDKTSTIYFFAKDPNNKKGSPVTEVPSGKVVTETKTGMLVLKNKDSKKK